MDMYVTHMELMKGFILQICIQGWWEKKRPYISNKQGVFIVLSNFFHQAILVNDHPAPFCHKINHPDLNNAYFASL